MNANDDDILVVIKDLQSWHGNKIAQLQQILDHKDSDIVISDIEIVTGSDVARGVRIGVMLAIDMLGKLPIVVESNSDELAFEDDA